MKTARNYLTKESLEEVLVRAGMIAEDQMQDVLQIANKEGKTIEQVLVEEGLLSTRDLSAALSIQLKVPLIDLKKHTISPEILRLVPEELARKFNVIPLEVIGRSLVLVMEDPMNVEAIDTIAAVSKMPVEPMMGFRDEIRKTIDRIYVTKYEPGEEFVVMTPPLEEEAPAPEELLSEESQVPVIRILNQLIPQAVKSRASDIHIEPQEDKLQIRFRIDGVLQNIKSLNRSMHGALISRLKIMAGMNIAERRRPQDGQCSVKVDGKDIDIRVACGNTIYGEMMVLRILSKSASLLELSDLGFLPETIERYQQMLKLPFGMVLIGGPTGSGKTTTLYASVNQLNRTECNILTIEDPIEYHLSGINQFQVNPKSDVSFANSLRAFMRLDPDVILVGEIRDTETAKIATQAALTGHLVLSSVHANDAVGIMFRLLDLGVEPFLICSALAGTVAQRIVRRTCPSCRAPYEAPVEEKMAYQEEMGELPDQFYKGKGCNLCNGTGYLGQCGVFELFTLTDEVKRLFLSGSTASQIRAQAIRDGMVPLKHDAMLKVKQDITIVPEVLRNVFSTDEQYVRQQVGGTPDIDSGTLITTNHEEATSMARSQSPESKSESAYIKVEKLLKLMVDKHASDLHLKVSSPPVLRIDGALVTQDDLPPLTVPDIESAFKQVTTEDQRIAFAGERYLDLAYSIPGLARFRLNTLQQRGTLSLAFRLIPFTIPSIDELELPQICKELVMKPRGLILVTGPAGSGKSTTLAAMISHLNENEKRNVISIEDPIEFLYPDKKCLISQLELGDDTKSFAAALKHALRHDPNVIVIGEMRDLDTISTAMTAAETGHLILGTLHTIDAVQSVDRLIDMFPDGQQRQVRLQLSHVIEAVLSQRLVTRIEGGQMAAFEIMIANNVITRLIREDQAFEIPANIEMSVREGMQTLDQALADLVRRNIITTEEAMMKSSDPGRLSKLLQH